MADHQRSAKPLFVGSIPTRASKKTRQILFFISQYSQYLNSLICRGNTKYYAAAWCVTPQEGVECSQYENGGYARTVMRPSKGRCAGRVGACSETT